MRLRLAVVASVLLSACATTGPRLAFSPWERPPTSSTDVRRATGAAFEAGDRRGVTIGMFQLAQMGATLSEATQARLMPLIDADALPRGADFHDWGPERLAGIFAHNAAAQEASGLFAEVPAEHRLIEGIAWDAATRRLIVGSVIDRRVLVRDGEAWREVPLVQPAGGLFGMAVDPTRRLLWIASAAADPMPEPESAFSGLIAIDLDRLAEVHRVPVPDARLGDVALGPDGTVYASDSRSGAIFRCSPGCAAADTMIPPGILRNPQGMALDQRGRVLFVADYAMGLLRVDLRSLVVTPLVARRPQMLEGIDGLVRIGPYLIAIQNGTLPRRIIRISLDRSGRFVEWVMPFETSVEGWGEPTLGTEREGGLLYVADGQWERYGAGGILTDGAPPRPTAIREINDFGDIIITDRRQSTDVPAGTLATRRTRS